MKNRKVLVRIVACLLIVMTVLPAQAFAAGYSTTSTTGVKLEYPRPGDYYMDSFRAQVKATRVNGCIYRMPMPDNGHGNLGTVKDGEEVLILAERNGYYFFETDDGRSGWNGKKYFTASGSSSQSGDRCDTDYPTCSTTGDELQYPNWNDYYEEEFFTWVKASRRGGCIYLMPMPQSGHGNLGTVGRGKRVLILAKSGGYLFFLTQDGRYGWNGKMWFK